MLIRQMEISRLITYADKIEDDKLRESKIARTDGGDSSHARSESGGPPYFFPKFTTACKKYGKNHKEEPLAGLNVCYRCGKTGHNSKQYKVKYSYPQGQVTHGGQVQQGGQNQPKGGQPNNQLYAFYSRQEMEETPNVVTGILRFFHYEVYALPDLGNLSFVTLYASMRFDKMPPIRPLFPMGNNANEVQDPPTLYGNSPLPEQVADADFWTAFIILAHVVANKGIVAPPNVPTLV
ncbi:uncharacterized protein LOC129893369 [Solanum dulcamara]|uniref:uncharacterized protein LOC129893369 n=1 Tax=Solanum dulcamara TaxID=45834 RepID=UPI0024866064|nr:uncharacterized protein LOC129893369 [Solanum dulcamara]